MGKSPPLDPDDPGGLPDMADAAAVAAAAAAAAWWPYMPGYWNSGLGRPIATDMDGEAKGNPEKFEI